MQYGWLTALNNIGNNLEEGYWLSNGNLNFVMDLILMFM